MANHPDPLTLWPMVLTVASVAAGAWLGTMPFLAEFHAASKLSETDALRTTMQQIQDLKRVGDAVGSATGRWQDIQEKADQTVEATQLIAARMTAEAQSFSEFMQKANDAEKTHLRLEVEKLRRSESDWVQILMVMLDHVYALHQAGVRSGKGSLITQLGHFQRACREVARRVGLVPLEANPGTPFQAHEQQLADADTGADLPLAGRVAETLATGYSYQGKLLRKALVRVEAPRDEAPNEAPRDAGDLFQLAPETTAPTAGAAVSSKDLGPDHRA